MYCFPVLLLKEAGSRRGAVNKYSGPYSEAGDLSFLFFLKSHDSSTLPNESTSSVILPQPKEGGEQNWGQENKMPGTRCLTTLILLVYMAQPGHVRSIPSGSKKEGWPFLYLCSSNVKYCTITKTLFWRIAHGVQIVTGSEGRSKPFVVISLKSSDIS